MKANVPEKIEAAQEAYEAYEEKVHKITKLLKQALDVAARENIDQDELLGEDYEMTIQDVLEDLVERLDGHLQRAKGLYLGVYKDLF